MKYLIITPVKNEELYIGFTLDSVSRQICKPERWVIVDDGSTDKTVKIIEEYCRKYEWIVLIKSTNYNEKRSGGSKVINAFNRGYDHIRSLNIEYDYLVKLDGDLTLPVDYFREIQKAFMENDKLGICGGYIVNKHANKLIREGKSDYHVRGALKAVRKICFDEIGGFKSIWHWDGIDELEAIYKGWQTKTIEVPVIHHRPTTAAYNITRHSFISGREAFKCGDNIILLGFRSLKLFFKLPWIVNSLVYISGYMLSLIKREKKYFSPDFVKFLNKFHIKRITGKILNLRNI